MQNERDVAKGGGRNVERAIKREIRLLMQWIPAFHHQTSFSRVPQIFKYFVSFTTLGKKYCWVLLHIYICNKWQLKSHGYGIILGTRNKIPLMPHSVYFLRSLKLEEGICGSVG